MIKNGLHPKRLLAMLTVLLMLAGSASAGVVELPMDLSGGMPVPTKFHKGMTDYEDPTISFHYDRVQSQEYNCVYWVARVKIASPTQLRTEPARKWMNQMRAYGSVMSKRVNAVVSCNGDFYSARASGYVLRQGVEYRATMDPGQDVLLVDEAGDFHILLAEEHPEEMDKTVIDGKKVWNAFCFGPALIRNGEIVYSHVHEQQYTQGDQINKRTALCQVGPLEYMIVTCAYYGLTLDDLSRLLIELGAQQAYNLDGGDSACLYMLGTKVNQQENEPRQLPDIVYFASAWQPDGE